MGTDGTRGVLEGPVSSRFCVALVLLAAAIDASRAMAAVPEPLMLLRGIVVGCLGTTLALGVAAMSVSYARDWYATGARVSVTLALLSSAMLAATSLWVGRA